MSTTAATLVQDGRVAIEAVIFDMDGVLASVGKSYRESVIQTTAHFGVPVTNEIITAEKKKGNANNDWILSKRLIETVSQGACTPSLEEVTAVFEKIYQGTDETPGLCTTETLIPTKGLLQEVYRRCNGRLAVVTGRPKKDCTKFLRDHDIADLFQLCICMEDAPSKPDPTGVQMACVGLNMDPALCLMIGDTPDDVRAGKGAGASCHCYPCISLLFSVTALTVA